MSENEKYLNRFVKTQMGVTDSIVLTHIKDMIAPHCEFDFEELKNKELDRLARRAIMSIKDGNGVRTFFADSSGLFINVEINNNLDSMHDVREQLGKKQAGLSASVVKIDRRIKALSDEQLNLFNMETDSDELEISIEVEESAN